MPTSYLGLIRFLSNRMSARVQFRAELSIWILTNRVQCAGTGIENRHQRSWMQVRWLAATKGRRSGWIFASRRADPPQQHAAGTRAVQMLRQVVRGLKMTPVFESVSTP